MEEVVQTDVTPSPSVEGAAEAASAGSAPVQDESGTSTPASDSAQPDSFARRLRESTEKAVAEERARIEREYQEKYRPHERATQYLLKRAGIEDPLTLVEQIEMYELQEQAQQQNVPVEVLQRLQQLEQKAQKADQYEQQQQIQQHYREFRGNLEQFAKDKGADPDAIEQFMVENKLNNIDIAYRAMRAEQLEQELAKTVQKTEAETIKKLRLNAQTSPGSVAEGAGDQQVNFASLSREKQRDIIARAKRGEIRSLSEIN